MRPWPAICALGLGLAGCRQPAPAAAPATPPAQPAPASVLPAPAGPPRITGLTLGKAVDASGQVLQPLLAFTNGDEFHASVALAGRDPAAAHRVEVKWSFGPHQQPVYEEYKMLAFDGPAHTLFSLRKPDGWPAGEYRVQLLLDGTVVQTREFEVAAPTAPAEPAPEEPAPAAQPATP